jgi:uncharacterized membrane protein YfcA
MLYLTLIVFILSFLFALGGVGSAVVLVPVIHWMGYPFQEARSIGLFVNALTLFAASYRNWRAQKLDLRMGLPVLIASLIMAPAGAWVSTLIDQDWVGIAFAFFLIAAGIFTLFIRPSEPKEAEYARRSVIIGSLVGALAGFLSGFLGIGGGSLIATTFMMLGYDPKFAVVTTAFVVPFSSTTGFAGYAALGFFDWRWALPLGLIALFSGFTATRFMQQHISGGKLKLFMGLGLIGLGIAMLVTKLG